MQAPVIGHEKILAFLKKSIQANQVSHAYIFDGAKGVGKKTVANFFAAALLCEDSAHAPCGKCKSCKLNQYKNHPDVNVLSLGGENGLSNKVHHTKASKSISVEAVREAKRDIYIKPFYGKRKVYLIYDADKLTAQAQNSLLKVLEEPPRYCVLILVTNSLSGILDTVQSRSIRVRFESLSEEQMISYLEQEHPEQKERYKALVSLSGGSIGQLESILEDDGLLSLRDDLKNNIWQLFSPNKLERLAFEDFFVAHKGDAEFLLDTIVSFLRDSMLIKTQNEAQIVNVDCKKELEAIAQKASLDKLGAVAFALMEAKSQMTRWNANVGLCSLTAFLGVS